MEKVLTLTKEQIVMPTLKEKANAVFTSINLLIYWIGMATIAAGIYFTATGKFDVSVYWLTNNQWKNIDVITGDTPVVTKSNKR